MTMLDRVVAAARKSPEGALLFAAGCALLLRGVGAASHVLRSDGPAARHGAQQARRGKRVVEDEAQGFAETARAYASDVKDRVAHSAEAAFERTGEAARGMRSGTSDAVDRMISQQPLAVGLIGIAAGALIAAALPGSRLERRAFAPVGARVGDAAEDARRRLKRAADRTRERISEVAEEHGLTSDGLKEAARDVAGAFGDELMAQDEPAPRRAKPAARASATSTAKRKSTAKAKAPRAASADRTAGEVSPDDAAEPAKADRSE